VTRQTVDNWEDSNESNAKNCIALPDLRVSVPKQAYTEIHERKHSGETLEQIAADYKISPGRVSQIATLVEARAFCMWLTSPAHCAWGDWRISTFFNSPHFPARGGMAQI
jgi:hypothetical protein